MILVNKRNIAVCILLSIVTFEIYGIYWMYLLIKNTRSIMKDTTNCTGELLCLIFVPFYSIYWWYTRGKKIKQEFSQHNYTSKGNGIIYLILAIFGLSIVSMAIMQSDFNSLKSETQQQRSTPIFPVIFYSFGGGAINQVANFLLIIALAVLPASIQYPFITGGVMIASTIIAALSGQKPSRREILSVTLSFVGLLVLVLPWLN